MNTSLNQKKYNLLSTSKGSRDNSIFSISSRKCVGISDFKFSNEDINLFFDANSNLEELKISNKTKTNEIIQELNDANTIEEIDNIRFKYNLKLFKSDIENLSIDFYKYKEVIVSKVKSLLNKSVDFLMKVKQEAKSIWKDRGTHNLYLTRYFLVGVIDKYSEKPIRAPLIMFNVDLTESKINQTLIFKKRNINPILNEKLIHFLIKEHKLKYSLIDEFKNIKDVKILIEKINKIFSMNINLNCEWNINFKDLRKKDVENLYKDKKLLLEDGVSFGIYEPSGGKLKENLEELIERKEDQKVFEANDALDTYELKEQEINDNFLPQITNLDFYQRCAVRSAINRDTVIHGPPGTGKSEVIINIIANVLLKNKKIVISSEKRAALDVLYNRLKSLKIFMLNMLDDKNEFYESINELSKYIENSWYFNKLDISAKDPETSKKYLTNKFINENFIRNLNLKYDFENLNYENLDFKDFLNATNDVCGSLNNLKKIYEFNVVDEIDKKILELNFSYSDFFDLLKNFSDFINQNNLKDEKIFQTFKNQSSYLKKIVSKYNLNLKDVNGLNNLLNTIKQLSYYLRNNYYHHEILHSSPDFFEKIINVIEETEKNISNIVNLNFFVNKLDMIVKTKEFFSAISKKPKRKKYYFDEFVYNYNTPWVENKNKFFYERKLNQKDLKIFDYLEKINNLNLSNIFNIEEILLNKKIFNPLVVELYFIWPIFKSQYIEFVDKFYSLNFNFFVYQNIFNFDKKKFIEIKTLVGAYKYFISKYPNLFSTELFNSHINNLETIDWNEFDNEIKHFVITKLKNLLSKFSIEEKKLVKDAFRVSGLTRKRGIYEYLEKYKSVLLKIFPIWVGRPEQIANYVPLEKNFFDYGIFDEASQMFSEQAYPILYRCKTRIVAGDQNQLKPSSYFSSRNSLDYSEESEEIDNLNYVDDFDSEESLLDRAIVASWNESWLQNHYRSWHKNLIKFSSQNIYGNKLNYASSNLSQSIDFGLEVIDVNGYFISSVNEKEAETVIDLLRKYIDSYDTIMIITSNINQKDYILSLVSNENNKEFHDLFVNKLNDNKLEIINIENVQGNEADLVIFSLCYAPNEPNGKLAMRFGPLINIGGKNRLNVAITRSRQKMIVVKSFNAFQIKPSTTNENLLVFKKYIQFLDELNNKNIIKEQNNSQLENNLSKSNLIKTILENILPTIKKNNLSYKLDYEIGNKNIDIAIINLKTQEVLLGIFIDSWKQYENRIDFLENIHSQLFLKARNYKIYRILESEWFLNFQNITNEVINLINEETIAFNNKTLNQNSEVKTNKFFTKKYEIKNLNFVKCNTNDLNTNLIFDSTFEEEVFEILEPKIKDLNFQLLTQYTTESNYRIDFVVLNPITKEILLCIEVDGQKYHSGNELKDWERQKFLEETEGYNFYRISEAQWSLSKEKVIDEILNKIKSINI
ncbi:AAA domain-containing protein [Mycoplasmoides pirum]|uniref:AAA domain-containing protein n=1 Tax=Mycoplasmoides pirum TaxID=2122 RepID=UPI000487BAE4|nr:AAA domain-containing protein [Mycoplasmoides pirum]